MIWIARLIVSLLAATADYAWFFGAESSVGLMAHVNCSLPTLRCIRSAKAAGVALSMARDDAYWSDVREKTELAEKARLEQEAYDAAVADAFATTEKYKILLKQQQPPPPCQTIINVDARHITNINPTFVSECTKVPELPGVSPKFDQELFFGPHRAGAVKIILGAVFVFFAAACWFLFCCCRLCWVMAKPSAPADSPAKVPSAANTPPTPFQEVTADLVATLPVYHRDVEEPLEEAEPSKELLAYAANLQTSFPPRMSSPPRWVKSPASLVESSDELPAPSPFHDSSPERPLEPLWAIEDVHVPSSSPPSSRPGSPSDASLPPFPSYPPPSSYLPSPAAISSPPSPILPPFPESTVEAPLPLSSSPLSSPPASPQPPLSPSFPAYERDEQDNIMEQLLTAPSPLNEDLLDVIINDGRWKAEDVSEEESEDGVDEVEEEEVKKTNSPSPSPSRPPTTSYPRPPADARWDDDEWGNLAKRASAEVAATRRIAPLRARRIVAANTTQVATRTAPTPAVVANAAQSEAAEPVRPTTVVAQPPVSVPPQPRVEVRESSSRPAPRPAAPRGGGAGSSFLSSLLNVAKNPVYKQPGQ